MSACYDTNIKLKGNVDELKKMIRFLCQSEYLESDSTLYEYKDYSLEEIRNNKKLKDLSDSELEEYIVKNKNKIELNFSGPYGRFAELDETWIFEDLACIAPNAYFNGRMSGFSGSADYSLSGELKDQKLYLKSTTSCGVNEYSYYMDYVKKHISIDKFCELFKIDNDDFDEQDFEGFFVGNYLDDVSIDIFREYFDYAKIEDDEFENVISKLLELDIDDYYSFVSDQSEEKAKTWVFDPLNVKTKKKPMSNAEKWARQISPKPRFIEIEGKNFVVPSLSASIESYIKENGGIIKSSVVLDTDYIIIGDYVGEEGTVKTRRALELNKTKGKHIIAMTDEEFMEIINRRG